MVSNNIFQALESSDVSDSEDGGTIKTMKKQPAPASNDRNEAADRTNRSKPLSSDARGGRGGPRGGPMRGGAMRTTGGDFTTGSDEEAKYNGSAKADDRNFGRDRNTVVRRGAPGPGSTRHREKDRHLSGTNRGPAMKKAGAGAHNWGSATQEATEVVEAVPAVEQWDDFGGGEESNQEDGGRKSEERTTASPADETQDFDSYKKMKEAERRAFFQTLPDLSANATNTLVNDDDLTVEGYVRHVKESDRIDDVAPTKRAMRPTNANAEVTEQFFASSSGGRGRGGRGGGQNGGNSTNKPPTRESLPPKSVNLNLSDSHAFPSLG